MFATGEPVQRARIARLGDKPERGRVRATLQNVREEIAIGEDDARIAMFHDVFQPVAAQLHIHRHPDGAAFGDGEQHGEAVGTVAQHECHAIALRHAETAKLDRHAVRLAVQVGKGDRLAIESGIDGVGRSGGPGRQARNETLVFHATVLKSH